MTVERAMVQGPREATRGLRAKARHRLAAAWSTALSRLRSRRSGGRWAVTAPKWVGSARQAAWESLSVTACLVPLLVRALPWGCGATVLPLHRMDRRSAARGRRSDCRVSVVALPVPDGRGRSPRGPHRARRLPAWVDRSVVRLCRVSALRYARSSHASVIPARTRPSGDDPVGDEHTPWRPGPAKGVPTTLVAREKRVGSAAPVADHAAEHPRFPIDVVYTWVDDQDPAWQARYAEALGACQRDGFDPEAASPARFHNRDELRYSLRSLAMHAPFVRNIYIVTAGQVPSWLDPDAPNLRVVPHEEILEPDCLPTFNSHAIESALHRIDGLAEHYLYLNDDFFFGRECHASTFFAADGQPRLFPDPRAMVPDGPCSPADRPVDSASKNTREIMYAEFDFLVRHKMKHVPYPQRRSVLEEMEQRFPLVFKQTARNPFRHHTDVNIPSCLSHYYAFVTGAAVPGRVPASYINIGNPLAQLQMHRLLQRADRDVFCLNDCPMGDRRRGIVDASVSAFLAAYFPVPAPFELDQ